MKNRVLRKRFTDVDVWKTEFGQIATRAVYDVFSQKFNIEKKQMNKYSFSQCLNALRKLEDPNYEEPKDQKRDD